MHSGIRLFLYQVTKDLLTQTCCSLTQLWH